VKEADKAEEERRKGLLTAKVFFHSSDTRTQIYYTKPRILSTRVVLIEIDVNELVPVEERRLRCLNYLLFVWFSRIYASDGSL
jgi:hypothetical protein